MTSGFPSLPALLLGTVLTLLLSGCLDRMLEADESDHNKNKHLVVAQSRPVWCQDREADNPLTGCWVSPRCDYDPQNYISTDNPTDDTAEDYWFKSVVAFVSDPGYQVLVNGQLVDLNGRWFLGGLWFTNDSCTGDPAFYTDDFVSLFYRHYGTLTTREGLDAMNVQMISNAANGANHENLRLYTIYHVSQNGCLYGEDNTSAEIDIPDDHGEKVHTGLDLEHCFTFAPPSSAVWMTDTMGNTDAWETFNLYQGNNVWVNTADKYR